MTREVEPVELRDELMLGGEEGDSFPERGDQAVEDLDSEPDNISLQKHLTVGDMIIDKLRGNDKTLRRATQLLEAKSREDKLRDERIKRMEERWSIVDKRSARIWSFIQYIIGALFLFSIEQVMVHIWFPK